MKTLEHWNNLKFLPLLGIRRIGDMGFNLGVIEVDMGRLSSIWGMLLWEQICFLLECSWQWDTYWFDDLKNSITIRTRMPCSYRG